MSQGKTTVFICAATLLFLGINGCKQKVPSAAPAADATADAPTPTVSVATISRAAVVEQVLPVTGTLVALRDAKAAVSVPVAGIVDLLAVRSGQQVTKGQVLAHISTTALTGQIQQAEATVAQNAVQIQQAQAGAIQQEAQSRTGVLQAQSAVSVAESALAGARATLAGARATLTGNEAAVINAQESLKRVRALFSEGLVATKDVEAAQLALRTAESQRDAQKETVASQAQAVESQRQTVRSQVQAVAAARAAGLQDAVKRKDVQIAQQQLRNSQGALATARAQLSQYTVRAPLSGQVTTIGAGVGESVDATTKIVTITDLHRLQLQIAVPGVSAPQVHAGQTVRFLVDALPGRSFSAVIQSVGRQVDPASNTVTAIAVVDNTRRTFQDGTFTQANIVTARHQGVLIVPRAALLVTPGANGEPATTKVMKIGTDGTVHQVAATTGLTQGDKVEITSGLSLGDRVATKGAYGLEDGTKVTIEDAAPAMKEKQP